MTRKEPPLRTGLIGCGNIGVQLARFLKGEPGFHVTSLTDTKEDQARLLRQSYRQGRKPEIVSLAQSVIQNDLLLECAGPAALQEILAFKGLDRPGRKILCMSSGGLIPAPRRWLSFRHARILLPSGALAGLDAIRAVAGEINALQLTTTKPAKSLETAPYVKDKKLRLDKLRLSRIIFAGGLDEAIPGFPQNINVAATLCLAARFDAIQIRIVADPAADCNVHEVVCRGSFGTIHTKTENRPSANPRTSQLAIDSAIDLLKSLDGRFRAGNWQGF